MKTLPASVLFLGLLLFVTLSAHAADLPTFKLSMNAGRLTPTEIEVPANTKFRLEITNDGTDAAEFESLELRKESVLAPGVTRTLVFVPMKPGRYPFFDDFHLDVAKGYIVVK
jgi:heme/copper-type cytochrome/quinol oxidase subunit 2